MRANMVAKERRRWILCFLPEPAGMAMRPFNIALNSLLRGACPPLKQGFVEGEKLSSLLGQINGFIGLPPSS
jgi:hypothetical protein